MDGRKLSRIRFSVVGRGTVKRSLDKNAELQVKLERGKYNTGEEIEISITAPVRRQRPDHDRARQSLRAALVQDGRHQQRAAHQGAGRF